MPIPAGISTETTASKERRYDPDLLTVWLEKVARLSSNVSLSSPPSSGSTVTDTSFESFNSFRCLELLAGYLLEGVASFPSSLVSLLVFSFQSPRMSEECLRMHPKWFRFSYDV